MLTLCTTNSGRSLWTLKINTKAYIRQCRPSLNLSTFKMSLLLTYNVEDRMLSKNLSKLLQFCYNKFCLRVMAQRIVAAFSRLKARLTRCAKISEPLSVTNPLVIKLAYNYFFQQFYIDSLKSKLVRKY